MILGTVLNQEVLEDLSTQRTGLMGPPTVRNRPLTV